MGTDIHIVVEEQVGEHWIAVYVLRPHFSDEGKEVWPSALARNYRRFAKLAGVRGEGPSPRGLPTDASATVIHLVDDGHSRSWLPLTEAAEIFVETERAEVDWNALYAQDPWAYYFDVCALPAERDRFRLVFWFCS